MNQSKRLLVVDDDPAQAAAVQLALRGRDYQVLVASSGNDALDLLRSETPDLILLDVVMPIISGFDVCRWIRANPATRHTPVIFLTSRKDLKDMIEGQTAGSDLYIVKPVSPTKLLNLVGMFLSEEGALRRAASVAMSPRQAADAPTQPCGP